MYIKMKDAAIHAQVFNVIEKIMYDMNCPEYQGHGPLGKHDNYTNRFTFHLMVLQMEVLQSRNGQTIIALTCLMQQR
jgi:hypothetical protein